MTLHQSLAKSNFLLIEGDKKIGKFTLALYLCTHFLQSQKLLILSGLDKRLFQKRLKILHSLTIPSLDTLLQKSTILNVKSTYDILKFQYGWDFLFQDIKKAIEDSEANVVIFHRIGLMLEHLDEEDVKIFIEKMASFFESNGKKALFTLDTAMQSIKEMMENYADIAFFIYNQENDKIVEIKNSIFPSTYQKFRFILTNKAVVLQPYSTIKKQSNPTSIKKRLLLITPDKHLQKLHRFLFKKSSIELELTTNSDDMIMQILTNPEVITYHSHNPQLDTKICNIIQTNKLTTKLIYLVHKDFIRYEDRMIATKEGCYEVLPQRFIFKEYIMILERALEEFFYSSLIQQLPNFKEITNCKKFLEVLQYYIDNGILFTFVALKTKNKEAIIKTIRNNDIYYMKEDIIYIAFLNILQINIENVFKKFHQEYEIITIREALEIEEIRNLCE